MEGEDSLPIGLLQGEGLCIMHELKASRWTGEETSHIHHVLPHPAPAEEEALVSHTCCPVLPKGEEAQVRHVLPNPAPPCKGVSRQAREANNMF